MTAIVDVHARQILDSRGNPTVEVDVTLEDGSMGRAAVPSGASTGAHEAVEMRDGDKSRWGGKGVTKAVQAVNGEIAEAVGRHGGRGPGRDRRRAMIALDGTQNKGRLGANAILGVSLAAAKAAADALGLPLYRYVGGVDANLLPVPMMNILNGGVHADNGIDFQEFMVMPVGAPTFAEALRCGAEIFHALKSALARRRACRPRSATRAASRRRSHSAREALDFIEKAVSAAGYKLGDDVLLALDCAASEFFKDGAYRMEGEGKTLSPAENGRLSRRACRPTIRSRRSRTAWPRTIGEGWKALTDKLGDARPAGRRRSVRHQCRAAAEGHRRRHRQFDPDQGQPDRHADRDDRRGAAGAAHGYTAVMSHRSGETEDSTIADLAVALCCGQIKTGSLARSDRTAKYNQLLRIEEELGDTARYAGPSGAQGLHGRPDPQTLSAKYPPNHSFRLRS